MDARTIRALREFFFRTLTATLAGTLDEAEVQEWVLELGLVEAGTATEADCEAGFEGEPGETIYRVPDWMRTEDI
jgi:hypothetical protein